MPKLRTAVWAPGARLAPTVVALALLGLLSMHGWGVHTGVHAIDPGVRVNALVLPKLEGAPAGVAIIDAQPSLMDAVGDPATHEAKGSEDGGGADGLLGVCIVILAAVGLGAVLRLVSHSFRPPLSLLPMWSTRVLIGRDPDPPGLSHLCVIRC